MKINLFGKKYKVRFFSPLYLTIYAGGILLAMFGVWAYSVLFIGLLS